MKPNAVSLALGATSSLFLIVAGITEWSTTSSRNYDRRENFDLQQKIQIWQRETSTAILEIRSDGKFKIGLGLAFLAITASATKFKFYLNADEWIDESRSRQDESRNS